MTTATQPRRTNVGMELVRLMAEEGHRVFTMGEARKLAPKVGLRQAYLPEALHLLTQGGWIAGVRRGLYSLSGPLTGGAPVHEFEIATALVPNCAISHYWFPIAPSVIGRPSTTTVLPSKSHGRFSPRPPRTPGCLMSGEAVLRVGIPWERPITNSSGSSRRGFLGLKRFG